MWPISSAVRGIHQVPRKIRSQQFELYLPTLAVTPAIYHINLTAKTKNRGLLRKTRELSHRGHNFGQPQQGHTAVFAGRSRKPRPGDSGKTTRAEKWNHHTPCIQPKRVLCHLLINIFDKSHEIPSTDFWGKRFNFQHHLVHQRRPRASAAGQPIPSPAGPRDWQLHVSNRRHQYGWCNCCGNGEADPQKRNKGKG